MEASLRSRAQHETGREGVSHLCGLGPAVPGGSVKLFVNPMRAGYQEACVREEPAPLGARPRVPGALLQEFFILLFSRPRCVCAPLHMCPSI